MKILYHLLIALYCVVENMNKTALISHVPIKDVPFDYHVYLLGNYAGRYNNTTVINVDDVRYQAGFIAKDMFKRGIKSIRSQADDKPIVDKIHELHRIDGLFNIHAGPVCMENVWLNIPHIKAFINSYRDAYKGKPAIIVSAGPSLNKNIEELKTLQHKAVIISAGSAIMALKKHGIVPHYLCSIDPYQINAERTLPYLDERTTLIADCQVSHEIIDEFPGNVIFFASEFDKELVPDLNIINELQTNATVTTTSLNLAVHFGCDPIVLVGQDMCYGKEFTHADNRSDKNIYDLKFEDIHGNTVKSTLAFKEVFDYFNSTVPNLQCRVINATEGGAGIIGADVMTLKQVKKELKNDMQIFDVKYDYRETININRYKIVKEVDKLLMHLHGYKKRIEDSHQSTNTNMNGWIEKACREPVCRYILNYMMWINWEIEDKNKVLEEFEKTLNKLKELVSK